MQNHINSATNFEHIFWVYKLIFSDRKCSDKACKIEKLHQLAYKELKRKPKKDFLSPWYPGTDSGYNIPKL